jgi:hypothetical protein
MAEGVHLPQAFQDGARHLQDVVNRARVSRDPRDRRNDEVHQDLRDVPHQDLHFGLLDVPPELDELHQLCTVVLGVVVSGLCLHQCRLMQVKVPLSPIELDLLLPQHLVEAEGVLCTGGVASILSRYSF